MTFPMLPLPFMKVGGRKSNKKNQTVININGNNNQIGGISNGRGRGPNGRGGGLFAQLDRMFDKINDMLDGKGGCKSCSDHGGGNIKGFQSTEAFAGNGIRGIRRVTAFKASSGGGLSAFA